MQRYKNSYLAHPLAIFLIISLAYNIPPIISGLLLPDNEIFFLSEIAKSRENSIIFLKYFLFFLLSTSSFYYFFYSFQKNLKPYEINIKIPAPISMSLFYLTMVSVGILIANPADYFAGYNTNPYAENNPGVNIVFFATEFVGSIALINIFIKKRSSTIILVSLSIALIALFLFMVKMKRLELMILTLSFYLFYFRHKLLISLKYIFMIGLIFGATGAIRSGLYDLDDVLFFSLNSFILEANYSANSVFVYINDSDYYSSNYEFLTKILYTPLTLIPSGILDVNRATILSPWPDYLINYQSELSPGGAANLIGSLLFQGGIYGLMLGSALIGLILSIYRKYLFYINKPNLSNIVFLISLCSFCFHSLRDSLFLALKLQIQLVLLLVIASSIYKMVLITTSKSNKNLP